MVDMRLSHAALADSIFYLVPGQTHGNGKPARFLSFFFFLFLLLHSLYTSYIVVKTCVKRCVILYVVFVLTISETPSKYWYFKGV